MAGSQVAGRGNRTEGSIIGGVLGAVIGSQVGRASNDNCRSEGYRSNGYASQGYQGSAYAPPATYYDRDDRYGRTYSGGRYEQRGYDARRYDDRQSGRAYGNGYQVSADGYYYFDPRRGWLPR